MELQDTIQANLNRIQARIQNACQRSDRALEGVNLVAVTKYAEWPWVEALSQLHHHFGENRPQQLIERQQLLPDVDWQLIGQLQRNKVRSVLPSCGLIHSIDSARLLQKVADVVEQDQQAARILIQVNVSGEASKSGFEPAHLLQDWSRILDLPDDLHVEGLMTMAPASQNPEEARETFSGLRILRDQLREQNSSNGPSLDQLSMGMSGDFEIAIEEGATIVRIGSAVFDGLTRTEQSP